jgi:hypothetical protein
MKAFWRVLLLTVGWFGANEGLRAQSAESPAAPAGATSPADFRKELVQLLVFDAQKAEDQGQAPAAAAAPAGTGVIAMDPFVVRDPKLPSVVLPPPETPSAYFIRTGAICYSHGRTVTKDLYFGPCGDGQLLNLKFSW